MDDLSHHFQSLIVKRTWLAEQVLFVTIVTTHTGKKILFYVFNNQVCCALNPAQLEPFIAFLVIERLEFSVPVNLANHYYLVIDRSVSEKILSEWRRWIRASA